MRRYRPRGPEVRESRSDPAESTRSAPQSLWRRPRCRSSGTSPCAAKLRVGAGTQSPRRYRPKKDCRARARTQRRERGTPPPRGEVRRAVPEQPSPHSQGPSSIGQWHLHQLSVRSGRMRLSLPILVRCDGYVGFNSLVPAVCLRDTVRTVRSEPLVPWSGHEQAEASPPNRSSLTPPRTSAARGTVFPFSNWSIALRGPIARALRTSRAAAPSSATRGFEKPARAGSEFVVNRHRRMNRTRFRDVALEFYHTGMTHNAVGNIDGEA